MYSLKRLVWLAFIVVGVLLAGTIMLGGYQYQLTKQYTNVIGQNERALFHFMTIREAITENMVSNNWDSLGRIIPDIEKLNSTLSRLKENKLLSTELKLALADKIDLPGLAIMLNQMIDEPKKIEQSRKLQERLRFISTYLIEYDRIIVGQARLGLINFQKVVIGALGLIISLVSFSLIFLHRNTILPLLIMSKQIESGEIASSGISLKSPVAKEVVDLAESIELLARQNMSQAKVDQNEKNINALMAETVNETTNQLNGIINYAQLLIDSQDSAELSEEQRLMLEKIMENGLEIAKDWQKLN